jgi:hypothetical protein
LADFFADPDGSSIVPRTASDQRRLARRIGLMIVQERAGLRRHAGQIMRQATIQESGTRSVFKPSRHVSAQIAVIAENAVSFHTFLG